MMFLIVSSAHASLQDLTSGMTKSSDDWMNAVGFLYQKNYYPYAVVKDLVKGKMYTYRTGISIYDLETKKKKYGRNLTFWTDHPIEPEVLKRYEQVRQAFSTLRPGPSHPLGCLKNTPLRYGDIEDDGTNELVIFVGNELLVFSPDAKKVIFSLNVRVDDWMTEEETKAHFEYYPPGLDNAYIPHYQSAANMDFSSELPGYRGYGKLYVGDYDKNGNADIIVWRKLYISRMRTEEKGFKKVRDSLYHFEKTSTGECKQQITTDVVIENWLRDNELTWQKGFPSFSECEGEEGQLIPEMHDPLLNDPDVLK